jgi:nucleotide-binding universal stress UspA family protein
MIDASLSRDLHGFATEQRQLAYTMPGGHEDPLVHLSERRFVIPRKRQLNGNREKAHDWREMSAYQTLVVGTDGSDTSFRAVDHAAAFAAKNNAKLIIAMAHLSYLEKGDKGGWGRPARPDHVIDGRAELALGSEGDYKVHGMAAIYEILQEASDRARAAGAKDVEARPIRGAPVHALFHLAKEVKADLLVVGNVGVGTRSDKWLGSVPGNVLRRAKTDVLLVHTTD